MVTDEFLKTAKLLSDSSILLASNIQINFDFYIGHIKEIPTGFLIGSYFKDQTQEIIVQHSLCFVDHNGKIIWFAEPRIYNFDEYSGGYIKDGKLFGYTGYGWNVELDPKTGKIIRDLKTGKTLNEFYTK